MSRIMAFGLVTVNPLSYWRYPTASLPSTLWIFSSIVWFQRVRAPILIYAATNLEWALALIEPLLLCCATMLAFDDNRAVLGAVFHCIVLHSLSQRKK
jgi:hypothetical protein